MTVLFIRREGVIAYLQGSATPVPARVLRPMDTWMGVYLGTGERVGFVNTTSAPDTRNGSAGVGYSLTAKIQLTLFSVSSDFFLTGTAWMPQGDGTPEFNFRIRSGDHVMQAEARIGNGVLQGEVRTGGEIIPLNLPIGKDVLISGGMGTTTLNVPTLDVGQQMMVDAFDPLTLSTGRAKVKCIGKETIEAAGERVETKVVVTSLGGVDAKAWVSQDDEIIQVETPYGFRLRKITPKEALTPIGPAADQGVIQLAAIAPSGGKPFRGARRMVVRVSGVAAEHLPPTDETQRAQASTYTIVPLEGPPPGSGVPGPYARPKGNALIQVDHPRIADLAREIVGEEDDPWRRALRIYQWVYENIKKVPVFSLPSAIEVLDTREGDCNEHTVLFTALARAAGVPTRIVLGVAWSPHYDAFYYHAWPEVHVGRWIWMDPTLGQETADATHIKLLTGNIENWTRLIPYLGQLKLEMISVE